MCRTVSRPIISDAYIHDDHDDQGYYDIIQFKIDGEDRTISSMSPKHHPLDELSAILNIDKRLIYLSRDYFIHGEFRLYTDRGYYVLGANRIHYVGPDS